MTEKPKDVSVETEKGHAFYFLVTFTSSAIAAVISKTATAPLERVKLILQTGTLHAERPVTKNLSIVQVIKYIVAEQGLSGLWRGNSLTVAKAIPSQALVFSFQDFYRRILFTSDANLHRNTATMHSLVAGGMASATVIAMTYQIYLCQNIISSHVGHLNNAKFSGIKGCLIQIKLSGGIAALYRGFLATSTSVIINRSLYFGAYDFFKDFHIQSTKMPRWCAAQVASFIGGAASYPMETIGRFMILDVFKEKERKKSVIQYVKETYKKRGLVAFFGGFYANILRSVGGAILLVAQEDISNYMILNHVKQ